MQLVQTDQGMRWRRTPAKKIKSTHENEAAFIARLRPSENRLDENFDRALQSAISTSGDLNAHHFRLLIVLALETGAWLAELTDIRWAHLDLIKNVWQVDQAGTSTNARSIPLSWRAIEAIRELKGLARVDNDRVFHVFEDHQRVGLSLRNIARGANLSEYSFRNLRREAFCRMVQHRKTLGTAQVMKIAGSHLFDSS